MHAFTWALKSEKFQQISRYVNKTWYIQCMLRQKNINRWCFKSWFQVLLLNLRYFHVEYKLSSAIYAFTGAATALTSFSDVMKPNFLRTAFCLAVPFAIFCVALTRSFCWREKFRWTLRCRCHVMITHLKTLFVVVVQARLDLSLSLQWANDVSVLPADFMCDAANLAVLAIWTQAQNLHGEWNAHALLLVVGWWNSFEDLQSIEGNLATASSVWNHS